MQGYIHSKESFGTVDGPGVRFVVFFSGCPMRCAYCHNPDTWKMEDGTLTESQDIINDFMRNKTFYKTGGITATGGEPMLQMDFLIELFENAKKQGIHTCLDTSGVMFDFEDKDKLAKVDRLLASTDLVMLDIKHINDEEHVELTGHSNKNILEFAKYIGEKGVSLRIRHVVVPGITFNAKYLKELGAFIKTLDNVEKIEILPYHSMGKVKYDNLEMEYKLKDVPQLTKDEAARAYKVVIGECDDI